MDTDEMQIGSDILALTHVTFRSDRKQKVLIGFLCALRVLAVEMNFLTARFAYDAKSAKEFKQTNCIVFLCDFCKF